MRATLFTIAFFIIAALIPPAQANNGQDTDFVITVKAKDAKFIGTAVGGAQVIIRDRRTGDIIANGTTSGGTGDTAKIMADSIARDAVLVSQDSAKFQFSMELWEPTPVTISATAPLGQQQSLVSVSEDMLLLPGKDYASGNGIILEIPGFSVDIVSPQVNKTFVFNPDVPVTVEAHIMKLCGCQLATGSPWPPERYKVEAHVYKDSRYITSADMSYMDEPGIYTINVKIPLPGTYRIMVTAFDPQTKEAGMDMTTVILAEK